jgi:Zn-dependent protease
MFLSGLEDGGFLLSTSGKPDMAAPDSCIVNRQLDATPEALWRSHRDALLKLGREAVIVEDDAQARALLERHHTALRDFHLARGVFVPLAAKQNAELQRQSEAVTAATASPNTTGGTAAPGGARFPEELAEIDRLQSGKTSWGAALLLLIATIALFVVLGAASWSLEWTLLLLPVLFFHEAGHYLAMRLFRYRNVRMFFLPLFGAAVVGRNHGAPGWKRAVVALAGPLPGIVVGIAVGVAAVAASSPGVARAALMLLLLNGFNLLPFLPLDGGWTLQAVLFNRHYLLDAGFRALAVLGLMGLAVLLGDKLLGYLAIPMAIGIVPAWKNGKIAHEIGQAGDPPELDADGNLPVPVLEDIIERVKAVYAKGQTRRSIAQHTLDIVDKVYARPPGALATLAILLVYAGAIAAAAVGGGLVTALQTPAAG